MIDKYAELVKRYGKNKVDCILAFIMMQDVKKEEIFRQYLNLTSYENCDESNYKIDINTKCKELYKDDSAAIEIINMLNTCNCCVKKYNTIITYGTFDLFHIGHLNLLKKIKRLCNNLIVAVSTDEFNEMKGKHCVMPFEQRADIVAGIKYVDKVIPENSWDQKIKDVQQYNVDCFVIGDDWKGKFDYLKEYCDVIYLPRTEGISTTKLKEKLKLK